MDVTYHGITRPHQEWAEFCGVSEQTMRWRLAHWGVERALSENKLSASERQPQRSKRMTDNDAALICTAYIEGRSEDQIAGLTNYSRAQISRLLISRGLKVKGTAPKRTVSIDPRLVGGVHIHIHTRSD